RTSRRPRRSTAASSSARWAGSATSPGTTITLERPAVASCRASPSRASTTTDQPRWARAVVSASPRPFDAPVTIATGMGTSLCGVHHNTRRCFGYSVGGLGAGKWRLGGGGDAPASRPGAPGGGTEGGEAASDQAGPCAEGVADQAEDGTADRRAAEEHDRLEGQDPASHGGVRPD